MKRIRKNSSIPLYIRIKEWIAEQIREGDLQPNGLVPSERELEKLYGISRMTARHALSLLKEEGLVYRVQGRGTFVAEARINQGLVKLSGFTEEMEKKNLKPGAKVLDIRVVSGDEVLANKFRASFDEQFVRVQRVRTINAEPIALHTAFLRRKFCPGLENIDLNNRSLYKTLAEKYAIFLDNAEGTLTARLANALEAKVLGINETSPVLFLERTTFLKNGSMPIEHVLITYRGDKYNFYVKLT